MADIGPYQQLMQKGLREHPELFRISPDDPGEPLVPFSKNQPDAFTLGAFSETGRLVGVVSFDRETRTKLKHKGLIHRMYVPSEESGRGIGRGLLQEAVQRAKEMDGLEQINLTVVATNTRAKQLYSSEGFEPFAVEKRGLKHGERYFDEEQMALRF
ncbi:MAG TPA: GNAT family N-acetyltransferase [Candidatus Manganitrophaceae bacterium]|nr:GNAT family N-acetyltransferase [Candidatus Manganitrophaceae bacterium]